MKQRISPLTFSVRLLYSQISTMALLAVLQACTPSSTEDTKAPTVKPVAATPVMVSKVDDVSQKSDTASKTQCFSSRRTNVAQALPVTSEPWSSKGSTLDAGASWNNKTTIRLGHISDLKDLAGNNVANIQSALKAFSQEKVDAIVFTGDVGSSQADIEKALGYIAESKLPLFVIIGNRENSSDYTKGLEVARSKAANIVNLNEYRVVNLGFLSLISMPGYYNVEYLHSPNGCPYTAQDVLALEEMIKDASGSAKIIVSHGPPRMEGTKALDRVTDNANVGDVALANFLKGPGSAIKFGLFGNIVEAGANGTDLTGLKVVVQNTFVDQLFINSGAADSVPVKLNNGVISQGTVGIITYNKPTDIKKNVLSSYKIVNLGK